MFTNRSSTSCSLRGYPGLSSVARPGRQVGSPATRERGGRPIATVVLRPGGVASAAYGQADALNFPKSVCHPVTALGLRVYPPNLTLARYLPLKHLACSSTKLTGNGERHLSGGPRPDRDVGAPRAEASGAGNGPANQVRGTIRPTTTHTTAASATPMIASDT